MKGKDPITSQKDASKGTENASSQKNHVDSKIVPSFDIVQFCKSSTVTISTADYLKSNPKELDKLVEFIKGTPNDNSKFIGQTSSSVEPTAENTFENEISMTLESEKHDRKPNPFYISLLLNGRRLNNCIIDSGASDNIMPAPVAKALGLTLTKNFGKCYAMDGK